MIDSKIQNGFNSLTSLFFFDINNFPIEELNKILDLIDSASISGELGKIVLPFEFILGNYQTLPNGLDTLALHLRSDEYSFLEKVNVIEHLIDYILNSRDNDRLLSLQVSYVFIATLIQLAVYNLVNVPAFSQLPKSYTDHLRRLLNQIH